METRTRQKEIHVGAREDDDDDAGETQEKEITFEFSGDKGGMRGEKGNMMETVLKYGRGVSDKGPGAKVRKEGKKGTEIKASEKRGY